MEFFPIKLPWALFPWTACKSCAAAPWQQRLLLTVRIPARLAESA